MRAVAFLATLSAAAASPPLQLQLASIGPKDYGVPSKAATAPPPPFRFSSAYSDDMVLQQAPQQAVVWGFAPPGANVQLGFGGKSIDAPVSQYMGQSAFMAKLPATPSSMTALHNITATLMPGGTTITLGNVLFGDVWVCSGQSNMQYPIGSPTCWNASNVNCTVHDQQCGYGCVNNSGAEILDMANYGKMRLSQNTAGGSKVPLAESGNTGWMTPDKMGGKFSATCWFTFRDVFKALATPRPIGLIETNVGGTPDQHWSSPEALDKCKNLDKPWEWPANFTDSVLWNGKVVPLLRTTIKGAIWYQGEANSRADGRQYNCSFPAMIEDWRLKWSSHTDGATDPHFPFGWAQLNSNGAPSMYANPVKNAASAGDPLGEWSPGFQSIRNAESRTLALPNTFQAVIVDTPVASGSVHSPYKQQVGARMARGALGVGYGVSAANKVDPVALSASQAGTTITVKLGGLGAGGVVLKENKLGFEALGSDELWHPTPVIGSGPDSVTVGPALANSKGVRYLYAASPCSPFKGPQVPYHCPVYTEVTPLGAATGEQVGMLPLGPFILKL